MPPTPPVLAAVALAVALVPTMDAAAESPNPGPQLTVDAPRPVLRGSRAHVANQLPSFGYRNVDVRQLSTAQVNHINALMHSRRSKGDISAMIGATLRRNGLLQRTVDRVLQ